MKNKFDDIILGIDSKVVLRDGREIRSVNFDNAATTPVFKEVIDNIIKYSDYYGSIGRGTGHKSEITTRLYLESRNYILNYFNVRNKEDYTVIYVSNTTDGINKLAKILVNNKDDIIISTRMEHHSNDLPWRELCTVDYVEVDELGRLKLIELEEKLIKYNGKVKYVTMTGASNVTGYINDIHKAAEIAHRYNAKIIVDGAQLIPHNKVNMAGNNEEEKIDFLVFSSHKLYAPFGAGAIIGPKKDFDTNIPCSEGGGTVNFVMDNDVEYLLSPERDEAGTPNFFGVLGMISALEVLDRIGFSNIHKNELSLKKRMIDGLKVIPKINKYGDWNDNNINDSVGIVVFNIGTLYHELAAEILSKDYGIAIRQGWFCAHPYCRRLMHITEKVASAFIKDPNQRMPGMLRVSFGIYNTEEEVDYFLEAVNNISRKI